MKNNNLVVDLNNSLLKIDLFKEALCKSLIKHPWIFFKTAFLGCQNRPNTKELIVNNDKIEYQYLPYDKRVVDTISEYKEKGYQIFLASDTTKVNTQAISNHLGLFNDVITTDDVKNNVNLNKLEEIKKKVGDDFIYLANSKVDTHVWLHCKKAIVIGKNNSLIKFFIKKDIQIIKAICREKSISSAIFDQIRILQWIKNILIFVPALASHRIVELDTLKYTFTGFLSFIFLASSVYIINDIVDLDHDRKHPKNKNRPIAAGDLSISTAYVIFIIFIFFGGILAQSLGLFFMNIAILYILLNILYSSFLKRIIILDIMLLTSFYALRLIAGHIPGAIPFSTWLSSFFLFIFFSLGLLKRYVDIKLMEINNISGSSGRGYNNEDGNILMSLGVGSGLVATLVLILYAGSEMVQKFYNIPMLLVMLAPIMLYWISRIWFLAQRGLITSDPVLFVVKDKGSYAVALCLLFIIIISKVIVI